MMKMGSTSGSLVVNVRICIQNIPECVPVEVLTKAGYPSGVQYAVAEVWRAP